MALYQFSFASFLEVMLLGNFDEQYLKNVTLKIEELAYQYRELYTDCYNHFETILKPFQKLRFKPYWLAERRVSVRVLAK